MASPALYSDLVGKPFAWGGRGPEAYDCFGLAGEIFRRLGRPLPAIMSPAAHEPAATARLYTLKQHRFVRIEAAAPWCLVTFQLSPPWVSHIGVVTGDIRRFIHSHRRHRVNVQRFDRWWRQRVDGFYTYDG